MVNEMHKYMTVGRGEYTYKWESHWAQIPDFMTFKQHNGVPNGRTHGVAVTDDGQVVIFNQSEYGILYFNSDGSFAGTWDEFPSSRFDGAHGLTLHRERGQVFLWLTDQVTKEVVKTTLTGETILSIARPTGSIYADRQSKYAPTWAAQAVDGTIFVADGYGSSYVSRYDRDGVYIDSFNGDEANPAASAFLCPHGIWIGKRPLATGSDEEVIYITDRGNHKVQVYDLRWNFIKSFHQPRPCCFDVGPNSELLVPDLWASVQLYDASDHAIVTIGSDLKRIAEPGWPNFPPESYRDGLFSSPHGGCFDVAGNIYIVEWRIGGRITRLTRQGR